MVHPIVTYGSPSVTFGAAIKGYIIRKRRQPIEVLLYEIDEIAVYLSKGRDEIPAFFLIY